MDSKQRKAHDQLGLRGIAKRKARHGKRLGRPPGERRAPAHKTRPEIEARFPIHVVIRVVGEVAKLRTPKAYRAIRRAMFTLGNRRADFRIVHVSLQNNHVHLIVEADDRVALARGMQGFQISAAKYLNRELSRGRLERRRGQVFADRYFAVQIKTVTGVRNALNYVLNNWRKHGRDQHEVGLYEGRIDPYSTGALFTGWKERAQPAIVLPADYDPLPVSAARSWLVTDGYKRAKQAISVYGMPGAAPS